MKISGKEKSLHFRTRSTLLVQGITTQKKIINYFDYITLEIKFYMYINYLSKINKHAQDTLVTNMTKS